jgi:starch synthase
MRILVAASEMSPYAKTGGLGDVLGALPRALAREGHQVKLFMPHYRTINLNGRRPVTLDLDLKIPVGAAVHNVTINLLKDRQRGLDVYLVGCDHYFGREALYVDPATGKDYHDNDERFILFARAVMQTAKAVGFSPQIVHAHDWQAALLPALLATSLARDSFFAGTRAVLTIHNLAHQGQFPGERFRLLEMPEALFAPEKPFEFYGKVNFLKAGISFAHKVTTVSPRYAQEIQTTRFGCGLEGVLRERSTDLVGILNGVDYTVWSPSRDQYIPYRYHLNNLGGKRMTKVELLKAAGLPVRDSAPLIGMIARLVHQKGLSLIEEVAERLLAMNLQMIVLGTGDDRYEKLLLALQERYSDKLKVYLTLDEALAHRIEAGSDIFLMPSLFEPCGLNQMYSLKYGTVPVVNHVGGLADTIQPFDPTTGQGTGFVFHKESADALLKATADALASFGRRRTWTRIMKNGMQRDFSWAKAVAAYLSLFKRITSQ